MKTQSYVKPGKSLTALSLCLVVFASTGAMAQDRSLDEREVIERERAVADRERDVAGRERDAEQRGREVDGRALGDAERTRLIQRLARDDAGELEVDRDGSELGALLSREYHPNPDAGGLLDTAMILTNVSDFASAARCYAQDHNGRIVGRIRLRLPAEGLRFFLASDIVPQRGFVGSIYCAATSRVLGTEVMFGAVDTAIEVRQRHGQGVSTVVFPVSALR